MSPAGQTLLFQGATRPREAKAIAERKKTLAAMLANVPELGAERMVETMGKAGPRDAAIGTGVAVDKMLIRIRASSSGNQTRVLFGPEALRCRKSRQQFWNILFRAEEIDQ